MLHSPAATAMDSAGNLFVADTAANRILKLSNGVVTLVAGTGESGYSGDGGQATSATLNGPRGVAVDSAGVLYIADTGNTRVRKISNGVISTVAQQLGPDSLTSIDAASGVAVDAAGDVYISEAQSVMMLSGGVMTWIAGCPYTINGSDPSIYTPLAAPQGMAVDKDGTLYIVENGGRIRKVSNGVVTTVAGDGSYAYGGDGGPAIAASFSGPTGVAMDTQGNMYLADTGNNRIRMISGGVITTIAGTGNNGYSGDGGPATAADFSFPSGLTVDAAGNIYVADLGNNRIRVLSPNTSCSVSVTPSTLSAPASGGNIALTIQTGSSCPWQVLGLPAWVAVSGSAMGTGPASVVLAVAPNPGRRQRRCPFCFGVYSTTESGRRSLHLYPRQRRSGLSGGRRLGDSLRDCSGLVLLVCIQRTFLGRLDRRNIGRRQRLCHVPGRGQHRRRTIRQPNHCRPRFLRRAGERDGIRAGFRGIHGAVGLRRPLEHYYHAC